MRKLIFIIFSCCVSACNNNDMLLGEWKVTNMNSIDISADKETLFNTFIPTKYCEITVKDTTKLISIVFRYDDKIELKTTSEDLGIGSYTIKDSFVIIKFSDDKFESGYQIVNKSDSSMTLSATHEGETINLLLKKLK